MRSHLSPHFSNGGIWNASAADPSTSLSPQRAANARKSQTRSPPHRSVVPAPWEWGFVRKRGFRLVPRRPSLVLVPILPPPIFVSEPPNIPPARPQARPPVPREADEDDPPPIRTLHIACRGAPSLRVPCPRVRDWGEGDQRPAVRWRRSPLGNQYPSVHTEGEFPPRVDDTS